MSEILRGFKNAGIARLQTHGKVSQSFKWCRNIKKQKFVFDFSTLRRARKHTHTHTYTHRRDNIVGILKSFLIGAIPNNSYKNNFLGNKREIIDFPFYL